MWEEEVLPRALQNHLLHARHLTTLPELWIPQYLERQKKSVLYPQERPKTRAARTHAQA